MPSPHPRAPRALLAPLRLVRFVLVTLVMALARALGGRPPDPKPEPRNLAAQVERKR